MTDYYVRLCHYGYGFIEDFWAVEQNVAYRNVIPSPIGTHYACDGEGIMTTLEKRFPDSKFHKLKLAPGEYFPRMARPRSTWFEASPGTNPDTSATARNVRTTSTGQLHALIQELQNLCRVVHPIESNFDTYGHAIRNIIIIACTEVEAYWKNILLANGVSAKKAKNRDHYVKLSPAMKLDAYRVSLPWYPWLDPIAPFKKWTIPDKGQKQCLPWYDAYNAIKHDRERKFANAKLIHAISSVTACFVMLCAQYGNDFVKTGAAAESVFFRLVEAPKWAPSEIYVPAFDMAEKERNYLF